MLNTEDRYQRSPDSIVTTERVAGAGWASLHQEDEKEYAIVRHYHEKAKSGDLVKKIAKPQKDAIKDFKAFIDSIKTEKGVRMTRPTASKGAMRDNQKSRVLSHLETSELLTPLADETQRREEAVLFFDMISTKFGVMPFSIRMISDQKHRYAHYNANQHEIVLPTTALNKLTFMQLAAYAINTHWNGEKVSQHGPEYVAVLVKLINMLHGLEVVNMVRDFKEGGIDVSVEELLTNRPIEDDAEGNSEPETVENGPDAA